MRLDARPATDLARHDLHRTIDQAFRARLLGQSLVGEGAFGIVYDVVIDRPPHHVIVKVQKFRGWAEREQRQLAVLRRSLSVAVPEVYHLQRESSASAGDALVLEFLPGITGKELGDPAQLDGETRETVRTTVIDVLLTLQAVRNEHGYGDLDGPFHPRWWDAYAPRVRAVHAFLHEDYQAREDLDPIVRAVADRSLQLAERIVGERTGEAVLVHGDFSLGNILFDPRTLRITGLIDPLDAGWADPELDVVHLTKSGGHHFQFVEAYAEQRGVDERFWLRYWFHMFWSWLSYYTRIGLLAQGWYRTCAQRLAHVLDDWFPA